jgi:hypothetical protein
MPASQAILPAAAVGVVAGLISSLRVDYPFIPWPNGLEGMRSLHAGIAFGIAVGFVLWLSAKPHPGRLLLAAAVSLVGWFAAVTVGYEAFKLARDDELSFPTDGLVTSRHILPVLLSGASAGAVGAGLTALGASIAAPALRRTQTFILIVGVGALFGCLLYPAAMLLYPNIRAAPINRAAIMLFLPWQTAMLGAIAYGLTRPVRTLSHPRSDALLIAAGLGVVSGFVSTLPSPVPYFSITNPPVLFNEEHYPLHAGLAFGIAVAVLMRFIRSLSPVKCLLAGAFALVAWVVAVNTGAYSAILFATLWSQHVEQTTRPVVPMLFACALAGAVGAGLTALGVSLATPFLRRKRAFVAIIAVGALFGLLFFMSPLFFLFVPWQAAVLTAIAYGLTEPSGEVAGRGARRIDPETRATPPAN